MPTYLFFPPVETVQQNVKIHRECYRAYSLYIHDRAAVSRESLPTISRIITFVSSLALQRIKFNWIREGGSHGKLLAHHTSVSEGLHISQCYILAPP